MAFTIISDIAFLAMNFAILFFLDTTTYMKKQSKVQKWFLRITKVGLLLLFFPFGWLILAVMFISCIKNKDKKEVESGGDYLGTAVLYIFIFPVIQLLLMLLVVILSGHEGPRTALMWATIVNFFTLPYLNLYKLGQMYDKEQLKQKKQYEESEKKSYTGFIYVLTQKGLVNFRKYDTYWEFLKEPVNIFIYIIYPIILLTLALIMKFLINAYQITIDILEVGSSTTIVLIPWIVFLFMFLVPIIILPLFYNRTKYFKGSHFIISIWKVGKFIALLFIWAFLFVMITEFLDVFVGKDKEVVLWKVGLSLYFIGTIIVMNINKTRIYLGEQNYINDKVLYEFKGKFKILSVVLLIILVAISIILVNYITLFI